MRIAFIGQRGVPATFGGIERHVEELGSRLAARGHEVVVWCRTNYGDEEVGEEYRGMQLRHLPTVASRRLEAAIPSAIAAVRSVKGFDIVHFHAIGPGFASFVPRLVGSAKVVQTIHGLDQDRVKWSRVEQQILGVGAWLSAKVPHGTVVVSKELEAYYLEHYGRVVHHIDNGVEPPTRVPAGDLLRSLGLTPGGYAIFVGRLVPEKGVDVLLRAFRAVDDPAARLVVVGGSSYTDDYVDGIDALAAADDRVLMLGYRYGDELAELLTNAGTFATASLLEGLPLTLLEAGAHGLPIVASDIAPHAELLEVSGPGHTMVPAGEEAPLAKAIATSLAGGPEITAGAESVRDRVLRDWTWERCADAHEELYERVRSRRGRS